MSMSNKIRELLVNLSMVEEVAGLDYIKDKDEDACMGKYFSC